MNTSPQQNTTTTIDDVKQEIFVPNIIRPYQSTPVSTYKRVMLQTTVLVANQDNMVHQSRGVSYKGLFLKNNTGGTLYYEFGKPATPGSDSVLSGGGWIDDTAEWEELHLLCTVAATVNDVNAGGIVAWGKVY